MDSRQRGAGCGVRLPRRGRIFHVSLRVLLWGAHWSHLLFFSSSHLASDAERRAPPDTSGPRDSETTFSKKSLGRNCSLHVPITALAPGVPPTSSYPSAHTPI